jgi:hypothetical protein
MLVFTVLTATGIALLVMRPVLPKTISKQITFTLLVPSHEISQVRQTAKFDGSLGQLSYIVKIGQNQITVSEQATPENFTLVPQAYDKVVEGMKPYDSFETSLGKISIAKVSGKQTAVTNTKGTLLFAQANQDMSSDDWRKFFAQFAVVTQ